MLAPLGLIASMLFTMFGFIWLCWMAVSLADRVMHFFGYCEPPPARAPSRHYRITQVSRSVSAAASDLVYSSGILLGTQFDSYTEVTVASLRAQLDPAGASVGRARFDAEGKYRIEPSQN